MKKQKKKVRRIKKIKKIGKLRRIKKIKKGEGTKKKGMTLSKFTHTFYNLKSEGLKKEARYLVRDLHKELLGRVIDCPRDIAYARVCYELQYKEAKETDTINQLPKDFQKNRKAALDNNINGFSPDLRELMNLGRLENGGKDMAAKLKSKKIIKKGKKKAVAKKKEKKLSVLEVLCDLYWGNNKTKYSDERIVKEACKKLKVKKLPDSYTMANVTRTRWLLNKGKIARFGSPKTEIKNYSKEKK